MKRLPGGRSRKNFRLRPLEGAFVVLVFDSNPMRNEVSILLRPIERTLATSISYNQATSTLNIMGRATRSAARAISSDNKEVRIASKKTVAKKKVTKEQTVAAPATKVAAAGQKSHVITIEACKQ